MKLSRIPLCYSFQIIYLIVTMSACFIGAVTNVVTYAKKPLP